MKEWKTYTVGEVCETISETYRRNDNEVVLVNTSDVLEGNILNHQLVENKNLKGQFKKTFIKEDILYSEIRPANKRYAFVDFDNTENYIASTKLMVLRPNKDVILPRFLFAFLTSKNVLAELQHLAETRSGTFPQITFSSELAPMEIQVPDFETQSKIVEILDLLEEKVKNNEAINDNLEQQSNLIFDNMFGQYYRGQTIPSGWSSADLGSIDVLITDYVANGSFKSLADNVQYLDEETNNVLIRLTDYNNNYSSDMIYLSDESYEFLSKSKLFGDEIIISNVGANVGTVFRCPRLNKRMSLGPNAVLLRSEKYEHYLYLLFKSNYGQGLLQSIVTGSAQPKFNKTNFRALKVLIPDEKTLELFNDTYSSIFEKITANNIENIRLAQIRDILLPKLMSGELDVSNLDI